MRKLVRVGASSCWRKFALGGLCLCLCWGRFAAVPEVIADDDLRSSETAAVLEPAGFTPASARESRLWDDIRYLASEDLQGRGPETDGIELAAQFIAERFAELGLETALFENGPFQEFTIEGGLGLGPAEQNWLRVTGPAATGGETEETESETGAYSAAAAESGSEPEAAGWQLAEHFMPLAIGSSGPFSGELVFAGYGITAVDRPDQPDYDDYAGLDVTGKVVIVLRKQPQASNPQGPFGESQSSTYAYFTTKAANANVHGAAAMILVNDAASAEQTGDQLLSLEGAGRTGGRRGIPVLFATRSQVDQLLREALGRELAELEQTIDQTLQPQSVPLSGWSAAGETSIEQRQLPVKNVIAMLPGSGELADQYVVVGGHYDHVGMGGAGSLAPGTIAVHPGADDNASGTVSVLELAHSLSQAYADAGADQPRRTLLFMAFTAEERGLLGSRHYVRYPRFDLASTVAMVNLDMVGRLDQNRLTVYGTGTATEFPEMIERLNAKHQFDLESIAAGQGPSDHASFFREGIPVFHFFTGLHSEYHRPSDTADRINIPGIARTVGLVEELVLELATAPERPTFQPVEGRINPRAAQSSR
jgi:hypothetical protein